MFSTNGFEADSLESLRNDYVNYYNRPIKKKDVEYIAYQHDTGIEVYLSDEQIENFMDDVNGMIDDKMDGLLREDFLYDRETMTGRDFESKYRVYEKD